MQSILCKIYMTYDWGHMIFLNKPKRRIANYIDKEEGVKETNNNPKTELTTDWRRLLDRLKLVKDLLYY